MKLSENIFAAQKRLTDAGVDDPALDARLLIAHALGCDRLTLLTDGARVLTENETATINVLIARRAAREPVHRILGLREFWGLPFGLNEATLEPRPDSETLIETALKLRTTPPTRLLDLGTGTGCLLLALLHEWPHATGLGIDKAPRAVEQATVNAKRLGLESRATFQQGDWLNGINEVFDLIICNPPYIPSHDIDTLQPEVRIHDPMAALDGGTDGLDPYRHLIPLLPQYLKAGGVALFEIGVGQAEDISRLMDENGFQDIAITRDLGGVARCVSGQRS
ncbi:MAG TPA: peptide chain release factor N(5)-glutamine methyltransferase [Rhodospirillaceae bacterium]|nr:peptide chain release factor N(5)-glutamine methyltransferase [Rhodospirillaceae bacterium]